MPPWTRSSRPRFHPRPQMFAGANAVEFTAGVRRGRRARRGRRRSSRRVSSCAAPSHRRRRVRGPAARASRARAGRRAPAARPRRSAGRCRACPSGATCGAQLLPALADDRGGLGLTRLHPATRAAPTGRPPRTAGCAGRPAPARRGRWRWRRRPVAAASAATRVVSSRRAGDEQAAHARAEQERIDEPGRAGAAHRSSSCTSVSGPSAARLTTCSSRGAGRSAATTRFRRATPPSRRVRSGTRIPGATRASMRTSSPGAEEPAVGRRTDGPPGSAPPRPSDVAEDARDRAGAGVERSGATTGSAIVAAADRPCRTRGAARRAMHSTWRSPADRPGRAHRLRASSRTSSVADSERGADSPRQRRLAVREHDSRVRLTASAAAR